MCIDKLRRLIKGKETPEEVMEEIDIEELQTTLADSMGGPQGNSRLESTINKRDIQRIVVIGMRHIEKNELCISTDKLTSSFRRMRVS